jgi:hypothetical protein
MVVLVVDGPVGCVNVHYIKLLPLNYRVETHGVHGLQGVMLWYVRWLRDLSLLLLSWYFRFLSEIRSRRKHDDLTRDSSDFILKLYQRLVAHVPVV